MWTRHSHSNWKKKQEGAWVHMIHYPCWYLVWVSVPQSDREIYLNANFRSEIHCRNPFLSLLIHQRRRRKGRSRRKRGCLCWVFFSSTWMASTRMAIKEPIAIYIQRERQRLHFIYETQLFPLIYGAQWVDRRRKWGRKRKRKKRKHKLQRTLCFPLSIRSSLSTSTSDWVMSNKKGPIEVRNQFIN